MPPLTTDCHYCKEELGNYCVKDQHHLYSVFKGYTRKCNLQAKYTFVPFYKFNESKYDNRLFTPKLARKIRVTVLAKTDENYISIVLGYNKALDMFRFFHPLFFR